MISRGWLPSIVFLRQLDGHFGLVIITQEYFLTGKEFDDSSKRPVSEE